MTSKTSPSLDIRLLRALASVAALTSAWSAVRVGPSNAADTTIILTGIVAIGVALARQEVLTRIRLWMLLPALIGTLFVARDVIFFNTSLNDTVSGIGSLPMLGRIAFATAAPAIVVAILNAVDPDWVPRLLGWWLAGTLVCAGFAILQTNGFLPDFSFLEYSIGTTSDRFPGLASHPNALAQVAVMAWPVSAIRYMTGARFGFLLFAVCTGVFLAAIAISGSRAGILLVVFLAPILLILVLGFRGKWYFAPPVLVLGVASGVVLLPGLLAGTRLGAESADASTAGRVIAVARGWDLFATNPFWGSGMGSWYGELGPLILLTSGGVILLAAYLIFIGGQIRAMWPARSHVFAAATLLSTAVLLGSLFFNNGLLERFAYWPALIGAAAAASGVLSNDASSIGRLGPRVGLPKQWEWQKGGVL